MSAQRLPPAKLMRRVGWNVGAARPEDVFAERGLLQWRLIAATLDQLGLKSGRGLDFGCGVGRILRAAVGTPTEYELWGCDIDGPSVEWLAADLGGRGHVFQSEEWPPLPIEDQSFDFAYAFSVFTHLVDSWSAWLSELHRVLRDDGVLLATVAGPGRSEFAGELVSEDVMGMNVLYPSASWDTGGPLIIHSEWWLRAHWGRAFEILELRPSDPAGPPPLFGQALLVLRKRPGSFTVQDLEAPAPGEPRELAAARQNVLSLRREVARWAVIKDTRSWRMTAPFRAAGGVARRQLKRGSF